MSHNKNCPICLSEDIKNYYHTFDYRLATSKSKVLLKKCNNNACNHIWSAVIPTSEELDTFYQAEFYQHSGKKIDPVTLINRNFFLICISKFSGKKVLDVGAGDGSLVSFLRANSFDAYGIEPSKSGRDIAKENLDLELIAGDIFEINNKFFDLINLSHVLEHIVEPLP